MELSISENMGKTKDKDINQFIDELSKALMNLEITNENPIKTQNKNNKNIEEETRDSFGFTETDYRHAIDEENFAPTIAKEFGLSEEDTEILRNKIDSYLKEYSKYCGIISYHGYDMNKNQYYDDWYENGKCHRNKLTEQEFAISYSMGHFYRITRSNDEPHKSSGRLFEEVKDAIKLSVQEQLAEGVNIKDINLLELKDSIRNNQYLKPLYDNFNKNKE